MSAEVENLCGLKREDFQTTVNGKQTDLFILKNNQGSSNKLRWCHCSDHDARQGRQLCEPYPRS